MTRFIKWLLAASVLMAGLAFAYQPPADPPFPTVVTRVGSEDRHQSIQKAIDDTIPFNGGSLYLDGQGHTKPFWVDRPVIVRGSNVEIKGRNGASTVLKARGYFSPLVIGLRYLSDPAKGTQTNCWQESADLDATAGKRYALRTRKQSVVEFLDSPLTAHPWHSTAEFTIDLAFRVNEATPAVGVPLCGAINYKGQPAPVYMWSAADGTRLRIQTADGLFTPRANWKPVLGQFYRVTVKVRLGVANGTRLWVDGVLQPMHENPTVTGALIKSVCNHGWKLGGCAFDSYQFWQNSNQPHDAEFHGFRVIAGPSPYTDDATLTRTDGAAITDLNRYFTKPAGTLVYLPLQEDAPADRLVKWVTSDVPGYGNPYGFAYFLRASNGSGLDAVGGTTLSSLWSAGGIYGAGLVVGAGYRTVAEGCTFSGGTWCVGSVPNFVHYPITFKNCELIGGGAGRGLCAYRWTTLLENVQFTGYKGNAITALGSNLTARQCLITDVPNCDVAVRLLAGQAGGMYKFTDGTLFNFEGNGPSESYIDCHMETIPQSPQTNLVLDGVAFANNGPTAPSPRAYVRLYAGSNPHGNQGSLTSIGGSRLKGYPLAQIVSGNWTVTTLGAQPKDTPIKIDSVGNVINP